jgi:hypothetical protein
VLTDTSTFESSDLDVVAVHVSWHIGVAVR